MIFLKNFIIISIWFLIGIVLGGAAGVKIGKQEERERIWNEMTKAMDGKDGAECKK